MGKTSKKNTEWFIKNSVAIHGDKYDYSKTEYKRSKENVCIICPKHGEFWQTPSSHLRGRGCPKCANEIKTRLKKDTSWFVRKAKEIHKNKYDYSKVEYKNRATPVIIICPIHGEFLQLPYWHLYGHDCPYCKNKKISKNKIGKTKSLGKNDLIIGEYNKKAYQHWKGMLWRCSNKSKLKTYQYCTICEEWLLFSNFSKWFDENYIKGFSLDKDILYKGNKVYSPETCCFVPKEINTLFAKRYKGKKELPIGVSQSIDGKKFVSTITTNYERKTLGLFDTVEEAFSAYKKEKEQYLCLIAEKYKEVLKENVYQAIKNYKIEIND